MCQVGFGGTDPRTGQLYSYYETMAGGYGGRSTKDRSAKALTSNLVSVWERSIEMLAASSTSPWFALFRTLLAALSSLAGWLMGSLLLFFASLKVGWAPANKWAQQIQSWSNSSHFCPEASTQEMSQLHISFHCTSNENWNKPAPEPLLNDLCN